MMLAAQILAGAVLLGLLYVLAKRAARWYLLRTLERRVEKVRKILEKHQASKFEKVDRLLFQLGNVQDREAVEIALHEVLENDGDRFGPRLRKIYNNIGLALSRTLTRIASTRFCGITASRCTITVLDRPAALAGA